jgi:hypothetical protein
MVAIACIVVAIGARHMEQAARRRAVRLWAARRATVSSARVGAQPKMISNSRPDTNRKVLVNGVGEHLLPTAEA